MKVIIDRFEENIAVVELDGEMYNAPRALFAEAREGDIVELTVLPRPKRKSRKESDDTPTPQPEESADTDGIESVDKEEQIEDPTDEDPAALFAKLRRKRKRK